MSLTLEVLWRGPDLVSGSFGNCGVGQLGSDSPFSASTFAKATADKKTAEKRCQTPNATRRANWLKPIQLLFPGLFLALDEEAGFQPALADAIGDEGPVRIFALCQRGQ